MDSEETVVRRAFRVRGRVQGVGFRWWTHRTATAFGLAGYVRNQPDGCVEVHVSGRAGDVAELERALGRGPSMARVESVTPIEVDASLSYDRFEIR